MNISEVSTPALCVDVDALERNLERMAAFFRDRVASLRPHFKAHKTPAIAHMQADAGCDGFTCATLAEAEVLAAHGLSDLLIANEVADPTKRERLRELSERVRLTVAVDSAQTVRLLEGCRLGVLVDVNVGLPRCGVAPEGAVDIADAAAAAGLEIRGAMGYEGHAMIVEDRDTRTRRAHRAMALLVDVAARLRDAGHPAGVVSAGGTGTYDITGVVEGVTEVQAGSYALMDTAYAKLGLPFEEALGCLTSVVSVEGELAVLDAGLKALAVDHGNPELPSRTPADVLFLSDEHTTLATGDGFDARPTDRMWLRPSHVDPTVNLHDRLYACRGETVEAVWEVAARGYRSVPS